jgi:predicted Zn finger-like uncharacterized protein
MIEFQCPTCNAAFRVKDDIAGRTASCKKCGSRFVVPNPAKPSAIELTDHAVEVQVSLAPPRASRPDQQYLRSVSHPSAGSDPAQPVIESFSQKQNASVAAPKRHISTEHSNNTAEKWKDWQLGALVRAFGWYLVAIGFLNTGAAVLNWQLTLIKGDESASGVAVIMALIVVGLNYFLLIRVGTGIVNGERSAVIGATMLTLLVLPGMVVFWMGSFFNDDPLVNAAVWGTRLVATSLVVFAAPVLFISYLNWNRFH